MAIFRVVLSKWVAVLACAAGLVACQTEDPGIAPQNNALYFPSSVALDPSGELLYVANANADLRYNGGTVVALDLRKLPDDLSTLGAVAGCGPDRVDASRWECDISTFVIPQATVRIGDFPGELQLSSDGSRLFVPVRGNNHLLWVDVVRLSGAQPVDLRCNDSSDQGCGAAAGGDCAQWDCDDRHRVRVVEGVGALLPSEPFGILLQEVAAVFVDKDGRRHTWQDGVSGVAPNCGDTPLCVAGVRETECCTPKGAYDHIYLTHLVGGEVSFFTSDASGVVLRDYRGGFFDTSSVLKGGYALAPSLPGDPHSLIYVSSRTDSVMGSFVIDADARIVHSRRTAIQAASPGRDVRGIAFSPGGEHLYAISQNPPSLVSLDMRPDDDGQPLQAVDWITEVCTEPSVLKLSAHPLYPANPQAQLAWVVCFGEAAIFVVDTLRGELVDRVETGAGPNGLVFDPPHQRAFIANFADNTIGVLELNPQSPNYRRLVARLGKQRDLIEN